jgi:hypothetical protein
MIEHPVSTIIPVLDNDKAVSMPLSWKNSTGKPIVCCIKLTKEQALDLADRLRRIAVDEVKCE